MIDLHQLNSDLAVVDRFTVQAETTADDVINWIKSFGSGKKAINLFQTEHDLMFGEAGNFYILLARNAIAEEITGIAINSWNQHTFSFKYDNTFSYSRLISNADLQAGLISFDNMSSGQSYSKEVTFPKTFSSTPYVVVSPVSSGAGNIFATVGARSASKVTINGQRNDSNGVLDVLWIAVAI